MWGGGPDYLAGSSWWEGGQAEGGCFRHVFPQSQGALGSLSRGDKSAHSTHLGRRQHFPTLAIWHLGLDDLSWRGAVVCTSGCPEASLVSAYQHPSPVMMIKNISRHCQMSPTGQNCPWLTTTAMHKKIHMQAQLSIPLPFKAHLRRALTLSSAPLHPWFFPQCLKPSRFRGSKTLCGISKPWQQDWYRWPPAALVWRTLFSNQTSAMVCGLVPCVPHLLTQLQEVLRPMCILIFQVKKLKHSASGW